MEKGGLMPIYEYKCPKCGYVKEKLVLRQLLNQENPPICPKCRVPMERKLSRFGFELKGEGWTEYFHKEEKNG